MQETEQRSSKARALTNAHSTECKQLEELELEIAMVISLHARMYSIATKLHFLQDVYNISRNNVFLWFHLENIDSKSINQQLAYLTRVPQLIISIICRMSSPTFFCDYQNYCYTSFQKKQNQKYLANIAKKMLCWDSELSLLVYFSTLAILRRSTCHVTYLTSLV